MDSVVETKILDPWNPLNRLITAAEVEQILGRYGITMSIHAVEPYQRACIHKSYMKQSIHDNVILTPKPDGCMDLQVQDNNTPEFVGDSILATIVAAYLKMRYPDVDDEGWFTRVKIRLVNNKQLGHLAIAMGFQQYIILSKPVEDNKGRENLRILGSMLEAWLNCIYEDFNKIDHPIFDGCYSTMGFPMVQKFFIKVLETHIDFAEIITQNNNYKDQLLTLFHSRFHQPPRYEDIEISGPPHDRIFTVGVLDPDNEIISQATNRRKQDAEQEASRLAIIKLNS